MGIYDHLKTNKSTSTSSSKGIYDHLKSTYDAPVKKVVTKQLPSKLVTPKKSLLDKIGDGAIDAGKAIYKYGLKPANNFMLRTATTVTNAMNQWAGSGVKDPKEKARLQRENISKLPTTGNKIADKAADIAGTIGTYVAPIPGSNMSIGGASAKMGQILGNNVERKIVPKLTQAVIKKAPNILTAKAGLAATKALPRMIEGQAAGALATATEGAFANRSKKEIAKNMEDGALIGGVLDLGLTGASKGIKALKSLKKVPIQETTKVLPKVNVKGNLMPIKQRQALNKYYNEVAAAEERNLSNPDYVRAENKLRQSKGLEPIGNVKSSVLISKTRMPYETTEKVLVPTKVNVKPNENKVASVIIKKERIASKNIADMTKEDLFNAIDNTKPYQKYKPSEYSIDWGNNTRGQGKRTGNMIVGGMSNAPQGKKTYIDLLGNVPELKTNKDDFMGMNSRDKLNYLKAREYGLNHDQAILYQMTKNGDISSNEFTEGIKRYNTQPIQKTTFKNKEVFKGMKALNPIPKKLKNYNPKPSQSVQNLLNAGMNVDDLITDTKKLMGKLEDEQYNFLKDNNKGTPKALQNIGITRDDKGNVVKQFNVGGTNPEWYSEFYKSVGRKPNNQELKQMAVKHLENGFQHFGDNPPNEDYLRLKKFLGELESTKGNLRTVSRKPIKSYLPTKTVYKEVEVPTTKATFFNEPVYKSESVEGIQPNTFTPNVKSKVQFKEIKPTLKALNKPIENVSLQENVNTPIIKKTFLKAKNEPLTVVNGTRIVSSKPQADKNIFNLAHKAYTNMVDVAHPVNMLDQKGNIGPDSIKVMTNNTRAAKGQADYIIGNKLINKEGKEIGEGFNDIISKVPKNKQDLFEEYLLHRDNVQRAANKKGIFGQDVTSLVSQNRVNEIEKANPEFKNIGTELNNFMTNFSNEWGVNSGRVDKDLMRKAQVMYPNHVPVYRALDPNFTGNRGVLATGNYLKRAVGGSADIIKPTESIKSLISSTVRKARQNEMYNTLLDGVLADPEKFAQRGIHLTDTGADTLEELSKLDDLKSINDFQQLKSDSRLGNVLTVMRHGKPVSLRIDNPEVFKALQNIEKGYQSSSGERVFKKAVTNPYKELITGSNPIFAVRNVFRDIPTAIINTENSPLKYTKNLVTGIKDMAKNTDDYKEYKALVGDSANFVDKPVSKLAKKLNVFKKFNEATETLPRYAEYKTTLQKLGNDYNGKMQGLYNANEITTNFGRYGNLTKKADAFVPYLNPAVQGMDKLARQLAPRKALGTVLKGAGVITAPVLIADHINKNNPHYNDLDNRTKDTYTLIPNMFDQDGKGNAKTFFKIPKAREYGVLFGALTERLLRQVRGDNQAFKGFGNTVRTNAGPNNPLENNIFSPVVTNLPSNKDFANRTIVPQPMQDRSPRYQYDEKTTELAKALGNKLNYSPKKIDYLLKSYTGMLYQLGVPAIDKLLNKNTNSMNGITNQLIADPRYSNQATTDFYDNLTKLKQNAADRNFLENIPSSRTTQEERLRNNFTKAQKRINVLSKKASLSTNQNEVNTLRQAIIDLENKQNKRVK